jgi:hypothetical protein
MSSGKSSAKRARPAEAAGEPPSGAFDRDKPASAIGLYAEMMLRYVSKGADVNKLVKRLDRLAKRREEAELETLVAERADEPARSNQRLFEEAAKSARKIAKRREEAERETSERAGEPARRNQSSFEEAAKLARNEQPRAGKATPPAGASATAAVATGHSAAATAACQAAAGGSSPGEPLSQGSATSSSPRHKSPSDATLAPLTEQPLDGTQQRARTDAERGLLQAARARSPAPRLADEEGDQDQDEHEGEDEPDSAKASSRNATALGSAVKVSPAQPKKPRVKWRPADVERLNMLCPDGKASMANCVILSAALGPPYGPREVMSKLQNTKAAKGRAARHLGMGAPNP